MIYKTEEEYYLESISEKNLSEIAYLFTETRGFSLSLDELKSKYNVCFFNISAIGFIAKHKVTNEVAATYAVIPVNMNYNGSEFLAAQAIDAITHPKHQKKGLFVYIANKVHSEAKRMGVKTIFAFPNKNSFHGFYNSMQWKFDHNMIILHKSFKVFPYYKLLRKFKLENILMFLNNKGSSNEAVLKSYICDANNNFNSVTRNKDYFYYKFTLPHRIFKFKNYYYIYNLKSEIYIGEIGFNGEFNLDEFNKGLKRLCFKLGVSEVRFIISEHNKYIELLKKSMKSLPGLTCAKLELNEYNNFKMDFTFFDFDTF